MFNPLKRMLLFGFQTGTTFADLDWLFSIIASAFWNSSFTTVPMIGRNHQLYEKLLAMSGGRFIMLHLRRPFEIDQN